MPALQREAFCAKERLLGDLRQSVPQNGRVHLLGSILKFHIGFPFRKNFAGFCKSVWLLGEILSFLIGSVSSIGGLIAATLSAATVPIPRSKSVTQSVLLLTETQDKKSATKSIAKSEKNPCKIRHSHKENRRISTQLRRVPYFLWGTTQVSRENPPPPTPTK